jgi:hypothetical protein
MILQLMLWFGIPCMSFIYIIARILVGNCFLRLEESARIWGKKMLEKFFFFFLLLTVHALLARWELLWTYGKTFRNAIENVGSCWCVCLRVKCKQSWLTLDTSSDQSLMNMQENMGLCLCGLSWGNWAMCVMVICDYLEVLDLLRCYWFCMFLNFGSGICTWDRWRKKEDVLFIYLNWRSYLEVAHDWK